MKFSKEMLENLPRKDVSVQNWMADLYAKTAADGTLRLLNPYEYTSTSVLTCAMDWDTSAYEKTAQEIVCLRDALCAIAPHWDALHADGADAAAILQDDVLLQVYRTFFASLNTGDFDVDRIAAIEERCDNLQFVQDMQEGVARGEQFEQQTLDFIAELSAESVSEEECAYVDAYYAYMNVEAARIIGDGYDAYNTIIGARRLCRLYSMGAPALVIDNELNDFAATYILHRHATSVECTPLSYEEHQNLLWDEE